MRTEATDLPNCRATGIGSTPHTDIGDAVDFVRRTFAEIPFWPQLPRRRFRENMYAQFAEHLPGIRIDEAHERLWMDLSGGWLDEAERFYAAFITEDVEAFAPSAHSAAGLAAWLARDAQQAAWAVKGQVTGPISMGLQIADQAGRPALYDDLARDVLVKNTLRQAQWQETHLRTLGSRTIISIDEPCLSMIGSAYVSVPERLIIEGLEEVFSGLSCWTCTHCCGNTDWSLLLRTSVDILAFDAHSYAEHLALYPQALRAFLDRGGMLAWGVVPNVGPAAEGITLAGAREALERALAPFERKGFSRHELLPRSLITPSCGTGPASLPVGERVMQVTQELSNYVREEHGLF